MNGLLDIFVIEIYSS